MLSFENVLIFCNIFLSDVRSCETLKLGAQEVSRQASQVLPSDGSPDPTRSDSEFLGFSLISILLFTSGPFSLGFYLVFVFINDLFMCQSQRLGPSASAVGEATMNEQKADQLLAAVTTLRDMMKDPEVVRALPNLPFDVQEILKPTLCEEEGGEHGGGVKAAMAGKPAPSKPLKEVPLETPEKPKEVEPPKDPDSKHELSPSELVNSSTHRREHARLTRRMQSIDPEKYPEMIRMWNGNRQDRIKYVNYTFSLCFPRLAFTTNVSLKVSIVSCI